MGWAASRERRLAFPRAWVVTPWAITADSQGMPVQEMEPGLKPKHDEMRRGCHRVGMPICPRTRSILPGVGSISLMHVQMP